VCTLETLCFNNSLFALRDFGFLITQIKITIPKINIFFLSPHTFLFYLFSSLPYLFQPSSYLPCVFIQYFSLSFISLHPFHMWSIVSVISGFFVDSFPSFLLVCIFVPFTQLYVHPSSFFSRNICVNRSIVLKLLSLFVNYMQHLETNFAFCKRAGNADEAKRVVTKFPVL
jgi:hypothetical protein